LVKDGLIDKEKKGEERNVEVKRMGQVLVEEKGRWRSYRAMGNKTSEVR
jgi:hypothetical protein